MKNRVLLFSLIAMLAFAGLAQAKTELLMVTHWNTSATQGALMSKYVEEYNNLQDDVFIVFRNDPGATAPDKVLLWAATDSMPDILPVSQVNIPSFVQAGIISPMSDDIVDILRETYLPGALQLVEHQGEIWGYPTENMPNAFTYDMVDFDNRGIGDHFPETWDDLLAVAKRLTAYDGEGNITRAGFGWNLDFRRNLGILYALTWAEGGEVFVDDDRKLNLLSEPVINAVDFLVDIIHGQSTVRFGGNHSHSVQAIRWAPGPYIQSSIINESGVDRLQEIKSARLPVGKNGMRTVANYGWVIAVPTATKHKNEVHDFLQWMTTEITPEGTTRMGNVMALLGSIPNTMADIVNQPMAQHEFMQGFLAPMFDNDVRSWPMPPNSNAIFGDMNRALTEVFNGTTAPRNALENLQRQGQQVINNALEQ